MATFDAAHRVLVEAITARLFPAAAIEVGTSERVLDRQAFGTLTFAEDSARTEIHTPFDLASLTKVIATTTAFMQLVGQGTLRLDDPVAGFFEDWRGEDRQAVTIADLLEHASGLAARLVDPPGSGRREFEHDICTMRLEYARRSRSIYSDLGFILLGFVAGDRGARHASRPLEPGPLEAMSLDSISLEPGAPESTEVRLRADTTGTPRTSIPREEPMQPESAHPDSVALDPVNLESVSLESIVAGFSRADDLLTFKLSPDAAGRAAPTIPMEDDSRRGRVLAGEVHDNYAAALGGIAGHAGLFGTAPAVGAFAQAMLRAARGEMDESSTLNPAVVARFLTASSVPGSSRALGWDTMLPTSSCGTRLSRSAFGHVGFTGTSLWIDPVRDRYFVLLTNRACGGGTLDQMRDVRRAFHDALGDA
jgi:CubicO group peptidase (beta-lactamase class C family)